VRNRELFFTRSSPRSETLLAPLHRPAGSARSPRDLRAAHLDARPALPSAPALHRHRGGLTADGARVPAAQQHVDAGLPLPGARALRTFPRQAPRHPRAGGRARPAQLDGIEGFEDPQKSGQRLAKLRDKLYKTRWFSTPSHPSAAPAAVYEYLGPHTHRVGLSNHASSARPTMR